MESIKFAKIDFYKSIPQMKLMPIFLIIAVFVGGNMEGSLFPIIYVAFGALIMDTTPFITEVLSEQGFLALLPAKAGSRTRGRYLYGATYILVACIAGTILSYVTALYKQEDVTNFILFGTLIFSVVLVVNAFQFIIFSFLNVKNVQILSLIRMVIPFAVFFGGNTIIGATGADSEDMLTWAGKWIEQAQENLVGTTLIVLGVSILITILFCEISVLKEKQREQ